MLQWQDAGKNGTVKNTNMQATAQGVNR